MCLIPEALEVICWKGVAPRCYFASQEQGEKRKTKGPGASKISWIYHGFLLGMTIQGTKSQPSQHPGIG